MTRHLPMLLFLSVGCAPAVWVSHTPKYLAAAHMSSITVGAAHAKGIRRIDIEILQGPLRSCASNPSLPCRSRAYRSAMSCRDSSLPKTMTCTVSVQIQQESLISYRVKVRGANFMTSQPDEVTYAGGPLNTSVGDETGRPVYWVSGRKLGRNLDLAFVPNLGDYTSYAEFTEDAMRLLNFSSDRPSRDFFIEHASRFNFWLFPKEGEVGSFDPVNLNCQHELALPARGFLDGSFIMHRSGPAHRDCANIVRGTGLASLNAEGANAGTLQMKLAHESGHAVFGLGDEYSCGGHYTTGGMCENVFRSEQTCSSFNQTRTCTSFNQTNVRTCRLLRGRQGPGPCSHPVFHYTEGPHAIEIMGVTHVDGDWQDDSRECVTSTLESCEDSSCY
jgi:hypothetical protein